MAKDPRLVLQAAPLLRQQLTTRRAMFDVLIALIPATLAGLWFFGIGGLLVLLACILGCVLTEWVFSAAEVRRDKLLDGSGFLTGLLLGLTLPPSLPLWMAFIGGMVSIGLGKLIWGGLGHNLFNPALVGRAFLLATFPTAMRADFSRPDLVVNLLTETAADRGRAIANERDQANRTRPEAQKGAAWIRETCAAHCRRRTPRATTSGC